jgi:hypothetical protein
MIFFSILFFHFLLLLLHLHISTRFVPSWLGARLGARLGGRNEREGEQEEEEEGLCDCTPRDHPHNTRYLGVHKKTMGLSLSLSFFFHSLFFPKTFSPTPSSHNSIQDSVFPIEIIDCQSDSPVDVDDDTKITRKDPLH